MARQSSAADRGVELLAKEKADKSGKGSRRATGDGDLTMDASGANQMQLAAQAAIERALHTSAQLIAGADSHGRQSCSGAASYVSLANLHTNNTKRRLSRSPLRD
jgi:hypothetical protein